MNSSRRLCRQTTTLWRRRCPSRPPPAAWREVTRRIHTAGGKRRVCCSMPLTSPYPATRIIRVFKELWTSLADADLAADRKFSRFTKRQLSTITLRQSAGAAIVERQRCRLLRDFAGRPTWRSANSRSELLDYPKWDSFLEGTNLSFVPQRASRATIAAAFARTGWTASSRPPKSLKLKRNIAEKGASRVLPSLYGLLLSGSRARLGASIRGQLSYTRSSMSPVALIINTTPLKVSDRRSRHRRRAGSRPSNPEATSVWIFSRQTPARFRLCSGRTLARTNRA